MAVGFGKSDSVPPTVACASINRCLYQVPVSFPARFAVIVAHYRIARTSFVSLRGTPARLHNYGFARKPLLIVTL
jgi:hypothetical protein